MKYQKGICLLFIQNRLRWLLFYVKAASFCDMDTTRSELMISSIQIKNVERTGKEEVYILQYFMLKFSLPVIIYKHFFTRAAIWRWVRG